MLVRRGSGETYTLGVTFSGRWTLHHAGTLQGLSPVQDQQWSNIAEVGRTCSGIYVYGTV